MNITMFNRVLVLLLIFSDNSDFDLHESYAYIDPSFTTPNTKVPWRQIDYNCITPFNMKNRRVPGLFEPYDRYMFR